MVFRVYSFSVRYVQAGRKCTLGTCYTIPKWNEFKYERKWTITTRQSNFLHHRICGLTGSSKCYRTDKTKWINVASVSSENKDIANITRYINNKSVSWRENRDYWSFKGTCMYVYVKDNSTRWCCTR